MSTSEVLGLSFGAGYLAGGITVWFLRRLSRPPRRPPPDPIGDLCRLMTEHWYEWTPAELADVADPQALLHTSGVYVAVMSYPTIPPRAWLAAGRNANWSEQDERASRRLFAAYLENMARRVAETPREADQIE